MTPDANDLCVFAVKRGYMSGRIDVSYNHPKYEKIIEKLERSTGIISFGSIIESISGGATPLRANEEQYCDGGIKFLRIQNITSQGFDFNDVKYITEEVHSGLLKRSQLSAGDLLMTITGRIGTCAVVTENCLPANINQHIVRIQLRKGIMPEFAAAYLNSTIGTILSNRGVTGTTRIALDYEAIKEIPFPNIKDISIQKAYIKEADKVVSNYKDKLRRANELLRKNPIYLIDRLGLTFDSSKTQQIAYAASMANIEGRIDADYYSPKFSHFRKQIEELPYRTVSVDDISENIVSGFAAGKQDQADDLPDEQRVPHLRPFSITPEGELSLDAKKYVPRAGLKDSDYCKKNEVIFNNTNSPEWVGKTTVFDEDVLCAASNHMTRITVKDGVNPYYVAYFFNLLLSIGYWKLLCTNFNNQAGVNTDTLKAVQIPLPDKPEQDQIVAEIMQRRSEANRLRKEALAEWNAARAQFEKELLGE